MQEPTEMLENTPYDELYVGQSARLCRTLGAEDIAAFAAVSGDVNPAHLDAQYAGRTPFHGVIAHGMWSAALISRLLGNVLPGPGTIYLAQTLEFLKPVRIGDELRITATVSEKNNANRHVLLDCEVKNQSGAVVLKGVATVLAPTEKIRCPQPALPQLLLAPSHSHYAALLNGAADLPPAPCAVVHPCSAAALAGTLDAARRGFITPLLVAPEARLRALADASHLSLDGVTIVDVPHSHAAAARAAAMAAAGEVALLVQGSLALTELLDAVNEQRTLRRGRQLTHAFHVAVPLYDRPLLISDGALHQHPTLEDKADIVRNAVELAQALGNPTPRVAILAASDHVRANLPSTLDAAALCKMAERGQLTGGLLEGPLAFDDAVLPATARSRGLTSPVAGHADILIAPDLEAGHLLAGQLASLAGAAVCGVVLGATVPLAVTPPGAQPEAYTAAAALARLRAAYQPPVTAS